MRLFGWVQNKLSGKQNNKRSNKPSCYTKQEGLREEFNDWPQGLLSIGTFGNNVDFKENMAESQRNNNHDVTNNEDITTRDHDIDEEIQDMIITPEEVGNLITKILTRNNKGITDIDLPLDRFLNCPSSLEVARRISNNFRDNQDLDKTILDILVGKCKELDVLPKSKFKIGKKSLSFLVKKIFVCRAGFGPPQSLRDTVQDTTLEKLLRAMLHKKLSPQNSNRASSVRRYIEDDKAKPNKKEDQDNRDHRPNGFTWDKTDSEYIVLEI